MKASSVKRSSSNRIRIRLFGRNLKRFVLVTIVASTILETNAEGILQIYTLATEMDLDYRKANINFESEHTLVAQKRSLLLPSIKANASSSRDTAGVVGPSGGSDSSIRVLEHKFSNGFNTKDYDLSLTQNLLNFEAWYEYQAAKKDDSQALFKLGGQRQELIMRVAIAYFDVLRSQENLASFKAESVASRQMLEQVQLRFQAGLIPQLDVYDSQANFDLASVNLLVAENELNQRRKSLSVITGRTHSKLRTLKVDFPINNIDTPLKKWKEIAFENNPVLKAANVAIDSSKISLRAVRASVIPTLAVSMGYNRNESENPFSFSQLPQESSYIAVEFSIPVFSGGLNRARMRQAHYDLDASETDYIKFRRKISEAVSNIFGNIETGVLAVKARAQLLSSAENALKATQAGESVGTRNVIDVLLAQRAVFSARREYANARFDFVMGVLELKKEAGILNPQDVIDLNEWLVP